MAIFQKKEIVDGNSIIVKDETDVFVEIMKSGENVVLFCNYIYHGKITAVNGNTIVLEGAKIVYETGAFTNKTFKRAELLNTKQWFVQKSSIESYGCLDMN